LRKRTTSADWIRPSMRARSSLMAAEHGADLRGRRGRLLR
jgi:hypothetical protein